MAFSHLVSGMALVIMGATAYVAQLRVRLLKEVSLGLFSFIVHITRRYARAPHTGSDGGGVGPLDADPAY